MVKQKTINHKTHFLNLQLFIRASPFLLKLFVITKPTNYQVKLIIIRIMGAGTTVALVLLTSSYLA